MYSMHRKYAMPVAVMKLATVRMPSSISKTAIWASKFIPKSFATRPLRNSAASVFHRMRRNGMPLTARYLAQNSEILPAYSVATAIPIPMLETSILSSPLLYSSRARRLAPKVVKEMAQVSANAGKSAAKGVSDWGNAAGKRQVSNEFLRDISGSGFPTTYH